jgi:hypothetical protein
MDAIPLPLEPCGSQALAHVPGGRHVRLRSETVQRGIR